MTASTSKLLITGVFIFSFSILVGQKKTVSTVVLVINFYGLLNLDSSTVDDFYWSVHLSSVCRQWMFPRNSIWKLLKATSETLEIIKFVAHQLTLQPNKQQPPKTMQSFSLHFIAHKLALWLMSKTQKQQPLFFWYRSLRLSLIIIIIKCYKNLSADEQIRTTSLWLWVSADGNDLWPKLYCLPPAPVF